ncbi:hypothetical protein Hypma_014422 [Hypsizygus marmoreus]|uniref:Uncharacterized protein n=1 Tax=Hypsizygus marmoreus TaxID=39966 RepID=A0A369JAI1_HYPMA|nr:hypothetical protein Hypma_014422 [Hypsizygus marmoreus]
MPPSDLTTIPCRICTCNPLKHYLLRILRRPAPYSSSPPSVFRSWYPEISYRPTELCYDPRCEQAELTCVSYALFGFMDGPSCSRPCATPPPSRSICFRLVSGTGSESTSFSISSRLTAHTHSISISLLLLSVIRKHRLREGEVVAYDSEVRSCMRTFPSRKYHPTRVL